MVCGQFYVKVLFHLHHERVRASLNSCGIVNIQLEICPRAVVPFRLCHNLCRMLRPSGHLKTCIYYRVTLIVQCRKYSMLEALVSYVPLREWQLHPHEDSGTCPFRKS